MGEPEESGAERADIPEAVVSRRRGFSVVWIVPLVAAVIGAWLVYKAVSEKGPEIIITFHSAEGLEAGKTKIKYKDVEVGQVKDIQLSKDLSHVAVTASMTSGSEPYLTEKTRFWVVRARVSAGEVSGLGTLLSGAYIGLDPVREGAPRREFTGLEVPPVLTKGLPGRHFLLEAPTLGSLDVGSPVYYRQIPVGQVVSTELAPPGDRVHLLIFVNAPYDQQVHRETRFWNASGIDIEADATGVRIDTQSLTTILSGGIAFETPAAVEAPSPVEEDATFTLFANRQAAHEIVYTRRTRWLLHFQDSVRGLAPGAPVEFRGIKIGEVVDIKLLYDTRAQDFEIPVLIELEPERIQVVGEAPKDSKAFLEFLVAKGLRAQLKTGNLLTGQLLVDFDIHPEAPPSTVVYEEAYPSIPTIPSPLESILARLDGVLKKLETIPYGEIGRELQTAMVSLNANLEQARQLTGNLNEQTLPKIHASLDAVQETLDDMQQTVGPDSAVNIETRRTLAELGGAARSIRVLLDYIERHPEALLFGKGEGQP